MKTVRDHSPVARPLLVGFLLTLVLISNSFAADPPDNHKAVSSMMTDSTKLDGKVVYVDFWASWCVPCRQSFPWMQQLYKKYKDKGLEIVAVNVDKESDAAAKFLDGRQFDFSIIYDKEGKLPKMYGLEAMPSSFLYDRSGKLIGQHRGFTIDEADSLETMIRNCLQQEASK